VIIQSLNVQSKLFFTTEPECKFIIQANVLFFTTEGRKAPRGVREGSKKL